MNWIDLAVLAVCASMVFWGASTGFFQMAVYFAVAVLAMVFSSRWAPAVGSALTPAASDENLQTFLAFMVIFMVLVIGGGIIAFWARLILRAIPFVGLPNRMLGALVALFVGVLLLSGVLTAAQRFSIANIDESVNESMLGGFLINSFETVAPGLGIVPDSWKDKMKITKNNQ